MPPRAGRLAAAILAACVALVAPSAAGEAAAHGSAADGSAAALEPSVLAEINALRARHGLAPLRVSTGLGRAADVHARAMVDAGFFGHRSADGTPFWRRIERRYPSRGYALWSVGENLLWASPGLDARKALRMWLASPAHRRNLLAPRWREVGLAAVHAPTAPGAFDGREVTVLTATFGVRRHS